MDDPAERINVTKVFLPPLEEYQAYLAKIWANDQVTNQGPMLLEFEKQVKEFTGVENFHFVTNGTLALQLALRSLDIEQGEVITTPFSYVATTSAILWEKCRPVFVDIKPDSFCIDPDKIEAAITPQTKAILPVHVFGYPCDVEKIAEIAKRHNLPVIYDAAHAFGVEYMGRSLLDFGDIAICSFHATKPFHTIEGGGLVVRDKQADKKIDLSKRFGHDADEHRMLGINAKASEFQAAMGLCNLKYVRQIFAQRKQASELYDKLLAEKFYRPKLAAGVTHNYAYYPILAEDENQLHKIIEKLNSHNIFPRRYFYPSLNKLPYVDGAPCPVSEDVASRILCLPLYAELADPVVENIARMVNEA